MFGYINPDAPYLFKKDETLYKALYCGLCKSIGAGCGQRARTALTYDMAFTSALIHNIRGEDVKIIRARCALHFIKKRPITAVDDTTVAIGCVNTLLAYYKLCDDKADGDKRGILRHLYKKGFKKAVKKHPRAEEIIRRHTVAQAEVEKGGCNVVDAACEPSANMMKELSEYLLGEYSSAETQKLFYALGKWVYLADALDDYEKDVKKGRFNVLYNAYGGATKCEMIAKCKTEMEFVFNSLFADMRAALSNVKFYFNHDLTDNIILRGIPLKTRALFYGECKCKGAENEQKKS
ncbi:MAG: hypothetical protein HFE41_05305 [Clostridia bacterium]|jgi:hypothetical protein|nr:hypothetical protein [Clostridia bacterium]